MNHMVASKEAILEASRNLIREQGWKALSIRSVAAACGVAVGSIYNYFDSKSDLIMATVESVWCDIFHISGEEAASADFVDCIVWFFESMERGGQKYPGFFTLHSMSFIGEDKSKGQQLMKQSWEHIQRRLYGVLMSDKNVRPDAFDSRFTPEKFVDLTFSWMISALLKEDYDSSAIVEVIRRSIY